MDTAGFRCRQSRLTALAPSLPTMPASHGARSRAVVPFVISPYRPSEEGSLKPAMPDRCLDPGSGAACSIIVHHQRHRKTGPCFPVTVVRCSTHGRAFTLYPPGHVPYGRASVVPVTHDGELVVGAPAPSADAAPPAPGADAAPLGWDATFLAAAIDGAAGVPWPREHADGDPRWWHTQGRRIARGAELVGITAGDDPRRAKIAEQLGVAHLEVLDGARRWVAAPGYRARGAAVMGVVGLLGRGRCLCDQVLAAGAAAGLWGPPSRWDPEVRVLSALGLLLPRPP